jgi:hypothetical protein
MVSTKNYEQSAKYKLVGRLKGEDMGTMFLLIPFHIPNIKTAIDSCIEAGNGIYITNAVIQYDWWTIILIGQFGYTVTGDVYAAVSQGELYDPAIEKFELIKKSDGGLAMRSMATSKETAVQSFSRFDSMK